MPPAYEASRSFRSFRRTRPLFPVGFRGLPKSRGAETSHRTPKRSKARSKHAGSHRSSPPGAASPANEPPAAATDAIDADTAGMTCRRHGRGDNAIGMETLDGSRTSMRSRTGTTPGTRGPSLGKIPAPLDFPENAKWRYDRETAQSQLCPVAPGFRASSATAHHFLGKWRQRIIPSPLSPVKREWRVLSDTSSFLRF
jgi:hypothetical protein